jgi:GDP-L-fucose synthase
MESETWPEPGEFWGRRRVCVTGGAGFLVSFVVEVLRRRGARRVFVPRQAQVGYDLRQKEAILQMLADARPDLVIHLAATVGGIPLRFAAGRLCTRRQPGAPGRVLLRQPDDTCTQRRCGVGAQLFHEAWRAGVGKFVAMGTVCAYPKYTPVPFREEDLCLTAVTRRRPTRPTAWPRRCCWCRARPTASSTASTPSS